RRVGWRSFKAPMLSVLIVNWNTRELLRACLHSLRASHAGLEHEIIVMDNDSNDDSAPMVAREFPEVILLAEKRNLGFAAGNNRAFERARGELIWLLNPDTEVLEDAPRRLIQFLEKNPRVGAVASALIDARSGEIQRSCRTFPTPAALWSQALGLARAFPHSRRFGFYKMGWWNYRDAREVDQPMASSFLLRRQAVEDAGGLFDEEFPIFFNDVDLCWRLKRAGWEIWFLSDARVTHWGGAATGQIKAAMIAESHRALRHFYRKWFRGALSPPVYIATVAMFECAGRVRHLLASRREKKSER
ncbi:MAG: glycosyltransferase family 2 protein, partial [Armatimonadetes bacterium]|nr:glycosyltransferase family 2 protein [Armatimonadota bacterium]